jgi:hypothetical protein
MRQYAAKLLPHLLNDNQKQNLSLYKALQNQAQKNFLSEVVVTGHKMKMQTKGQCFKATIDTQAEFQGVLDSSRKWRIPEMVPAVENVQNPVHTTLKGSTDSNFYTAPVEKHLAHTSCTVSGCMCTHPYTYTKVTQDSVNQSVKCTLK